MQQSEKVYDVPVQAAVMLFDLTSIICLDKEGAGAGGGGGGGGGGGVDGRLCLLNGAEFFEVLSQQSLQLFGSKKLCSVHLDNSNLHHTWGDCIGYCMPCHAR